MPRRVRIIKAHLDVSEHDERSRARPRQRLGLPSPRPAVAAIAVTVVEVQAGVRSPWQLERVSHYSLWPVWDRFARPAPADPAATAARPMAIFVQEHTPGLVNATVVVEFAGTVQPLALGLDGARGWWELMELECSSEVALERSLGSPDLTRWGLKSSGHPSLLRGTPAEPEGIALPWAERWPSTELSRAPESFDTPGIDLG